MTAQEVVDELRPLATEKNKKTWMNYGATEPCFGVKVEDMKKIQKRVKKDYRLALDLFDTGIADMMYLAGLVTDDSQMTKQDLQKWIENANGEWNTRWMVPWVASESPHGREIALEWMESKDETIAAAGWHTYSSLLTIKPDSELNLAEIESLLKRAAATIHQQPNLIRSAMNSFVINVGCYVAPLHDLAVRTANEIGKVNLESAGSCKVSNAPEEIQKFAARSPIGRKRKTAKC